MAPNDEKLELPAAPRAARLAREFVRRRLANVGAETLDDVTLCVSELVTNALDHATPPYELRVGHTDGRLRVEVDDMSIGEPTVEPVSPASARGRGMYIVSHIATTWGFSVRGGGKTVWAEFAPS